MITEAEKSAFDAACAALERATDEVLRLEQQVEAGGGDLELARRRYERAQLDYRSCLLRLRAAALTAPPASKTRTVIVGSDAHLRQSLSVLLRVRRQMDTSDVDFFCWYDEASRSNPQLVIVDVGDRTLKIATWFLETLRNQTPKPYVIATAWPHLAGLLEGKVDSVVGKPLTTDHLLAAIDQFETAGAHPLDANDA
jgi:hypothetical protein